MDVCGINRTIPNDLCIRDETSRKSRRLFGVQGGPAGYSHHHSRDARPPRENLTDFRIEIFSASFPTRPGTHCPCFDMGYPTFVAIETSIAWISRVSLRFNCNDTLFPIPISIDSLSLSLFVCACLIRSRKYNCVYHGTII